MDSIYLFFTGILIGSVVSWLLIRIINKSRFVARNEFDALAERASVTNTELTVEKQKVKTISESLSHSESQLNDKNGEIAELISSLSSKKTELQGTEKQLNEAKETISFDKKVLDEAQVTITSLEREKAFLKANLDTATEAIRVFQEDAKQLKFDLQQKTNEFNEANKFVAELTATNKSLQEKLDTQKNEIAETKKQFNIEFENIAARILDDKTKKFTDLNKTNLENILNPFNNDIKDFKKKVEEVYDKESKERFSLGREVERLVIANQKISEEANNLTNALTTSGKTQGEWGQMILESILEKSGLVKDREYFVQEYLKDNNGNYLVNDRGVRMQPDVIVVYPDNRKVIVDSKVSLTAYNRYTNSATKDDETKALSEHLKSIRKHVDDLSGKNYQDFAPSLDFVMMFVPIEPAYLAAIHANQDLWSYAYNKRILLTSPSNLIVALKMIVDLWKRDYQNKNHQEIVERGGKLYDKFALVLESFKSIGTNLKATQHSYNEAINRLSEGNDNVLKQVEKLKNLGVKAKKNLPTSDSFQSLNLDEEKSEPSMPNEE